MDQAFIDQLNNRFHQSTPEEILRYFVQNYPNKIIFATSLGAEDQVITHLIACLDKPIPIFTLDTGRLFPETYETLYRTVNRYEIDIQVFFPDAAKVEEMVNSKGINLFYESIENRKLCCHFRKTEPLQRALQGAEVWICGLRRQQSNLRSTHQLVEWDENYQLLKVNPLMNWDEKQLWEFIHTNNIPYNPLHDKGYPSIGCQPCTRAIEPGEDIRSGRWWWEISGNKECGLHKE